MHVDGFDWISPSPRWRGQPRYPIIDLDILRHKSTARRQLPGPKHTTSLRSVQEARLRFRFRYFSLADVLIARDEARHKRDTRPCRETGGLSRTICPENCRTLLAIIYATRCRFRNSRRNFVTSFPDFFFEEILIEMGCVLFKSVTHASGTPLGARVMNRSQCCLH